jgi:phosphoribosylformylglycinamidine synthase
MRIKNSDASGDPSLLSSRSAAEGSALPTSKPQRGIAMALAGNGRWAYLDPKLGAMHAVAEAARKVACTGATPVAATNCLNFGNPEKPEIMAQLSAAIDGIAEACTALGTPITGGNVSLYNETRGEGIYPTPVIGVVGLLEDVSKAVPSGFQRVGDRLLLLQSTVETPAALEQELGSSDFARTNCSSLWGTPPWINLDAEAALNKALISLAQRGLIHSAKDVSDGGLATALAQASFSNNVGVKATLGALSESEYATALFAENAAEVLVTCSVEDYGMICTLLDKDGDIWPLDLGETIADRVEINAGGIPLVDTTIAELRQAWSSTLEAQLAAEVVTA